MALLNVIHLKSLVSIGDIVKKKFNCQATGFLIGFIARNSKDIAKRKYYIFLLTNRHVFEGKNETHLRLNKKDGKSEIFRQELYFPDKKPRWLAHKNKEVDLALLHVNPGNLEERSIDSIFLNEEIFAYWKHFKKIGIEVGDEVEVYVLGFPMGIAGDLQNQPYVKGGIISRLDKEIVKQKRRFLIDSSIFPGNSGSPVILKPTISSLSGTLAVSQVYLLGVVSEYLPYEESLFTHQTNPPSVVSLERENSGLSYVVPMDYASQIFRRWIKEKKQLEKAQEQTQKIDENLKNPTDEKKLES